MALAIAGGSACGLPADDSVAESTQTIIGGGVDLGDPAVVMLPGCTGTLVADRVVMTAAHCIEWPVGRVGFGSDRDSFFATRNVIDQIHSRYYVGYGAGGDIALLRLADPAPAEVEPVPLNLHPLDESFVGAEVRSIGFGVTDGETQEGFGTKRQVTLLVREVTNEHIWIGTSEHNVCNGDSGGPHMMQFDDLEHVAGVTSFGYEECTGSSAHCRVDVYAEKFLIPVIDAWSGPCRDDGVCVTEGCRTPDPDCDPCGLEGTCMTGCEEKDLDCPISGFLGDPCESREDCESLFCREAPEDPRVKYCSTECDPDHPEDFWGCKPPLSSCAQEPGGEYLCRYSGLTPGVQGALCTNSDECRSGHCFPPGDGICAEECGEAQPECDELYVCENIGAGINACILPEEEGCCRASPSRPEGRLPAHLALVGLLVLLLVARKRRIALHNRAEN